MFLFLDNQNYHISWLQQGSTNRKMCKCVLPEWACPKRGESEKLFSALLHLQVLHIEEENFFPACPGVYPSTSLLSPLPASGSETKAPIGFTHTVNLAGVLEER